MRVSPIVVVGGVTTMTPVYTDQVGVYIDMLEGLLGPEASARWRATAITALSTLVGAVSMARAVNDEALSREILASAAAELKAQLD